MAVYPILAAMATAAGLFSGMRLSTWAPLWATDIGTLCAGALQEKAAARAARMMRRRFML